MAIPMIETREIMDIKEFFLPFSKYLRAIKNSNFTFTHPYEIVNIILLLQHEGVNVEIV